MSTSPVCDKSASLSNSNLCAQATPCNPKFGWTDSMLKVLLETLIEKDEEERGGSAECPHSNSLWATVAEACQAAAPNQCQGQPPSFPDLLDRLFGDDAMSSTRVVPPHDTAIGVNHDDVFRPTEIEYEGNGSHADQQDCVVPFSTDDIPIRTASNEFQLFLVAFKEHRGDARVEASTLGKEFCENLQYKAQDLVLYAFDDVLEAERFLVMGPKERLSYVVLTLHNAQSHELITTEELDEALDALCGM
ncbi:unnamed protein product [Periconia digitata]|uniref:Uncharacterized protein n=1 Tax=Periconia digitata TaxID=1303443 RepID=A0A9W4XHG1_9PLEO|nr:unnamed protein product [Periconia digitata]